MFLIKESSSNYGYDFISIEDKTVVRPNISPGSNICSALYVVGNVYDYEYGILLHPDQAPACEKECSDEENMDHDL